MSKVTTADCKEFLSKFFAISQQWPPDQFKKAVSVASNWKRAAKCNPSNSQHISREGEYMIFPEGVELNRFGHPSKMMFEHSSNFVVEREFFCEPTEGTIAYLVLERPDGTLALGNYIGD